MLVGSSVGIRQCAVHMKGGWDVGRLERGYQAVRGAQEGRLGCW